PRPRRPPPGSHHHARTRTAHPARHPWRRTRRQSVPQGGFRRRPCLGGRLAGPRPRRPGGDVRRVAALEGRVPRVSGLRMLAAGLAATAWLLASAPALATGPRAASGQDPAADAAPAEAPAVLVPATRSGREIYARFREGLADPVCEPESSSPRWRKHFAKAPERLGNQDDQALALFGYVVDQLRASSLPTEYALIPFVESGYKPDARSRLGPAGMWQFIRLTARAHKV